MKNKKGQSTVEYLLVVTAVITILMITIPRVIRHYRSALGYTSYDMRIMSYRLHRSHK